VLVLLPAFVLVLVLVRVVILGGKYSGGSGDFSGYGGDDESSIRVFVIPGFAFLISSTVDYFSISAGGLSVVEIRAATKGKAISDSDCTVLNFTSQTVASKPKDLIDARPQTRCLHSSETRSPAPLRCDFSQLRYAP
jgi:hypothetical protein